MKTKKWLWITLSVLLTLVVLVGVAGAGFRYGVMQSPAFVKMQEARMQQKLAQPPKQQAQNFDQKPNGRNPQMQGFDQHGNFGHGFDQHRGFNRGRGGFGSPLFGLIHLLILGALLWFGYKYVKNSGWKLVREAQPAPVANQPASVEEKKPEA